MSNQKIYKADRIFTGNEMLHGHFIEVKDAIIQKISDEHSLLAGKEVIDFGDAIIAPAFIDLQLYGAHGRLLAIYPAAQTVKEIALYSKNGGALHCLPTVATNTYETIFACIDAIKDYWRKGGEGVLGLHVEGPWINVEKRGAHRQEWIFSPSLQQAKELLDYGKDVIKIITLAPECCSPKVIDLIKSYNIIVSAGHSNATYQQASQAFDDGIHLTTHLFNAMSPLHHRQPGLAGAVLDHPSVLCSLVPDGHHVHFAAIRIAKKIMGERLFAITDAVTETTEGYYTHHFEGDKYTANGILSGSCLTMHKAFLNLVKHCSVGVEEALRMCSLYPARAIKRQDTLGIIKEQAKANMIALGSDLRLLQTIGK